MKNTILKNYIYNLTYSVLNIIIPLITIPYVSRVLLSDGVGRVSYAQNVASYFVLVASLGIPNYGIKVIAKNSSDREQLSLRFWEIFLINAFSTLMSTVAFYCLVLCNNLFAEDRSIYIIVGFSVILNFMNVDWFYRGVEDFKYITIRNIAIKTISLACIFLFVHTKDDIIVYALIVTSSTCVNYVFNIVHLRKYISIIHSGSLSIKKHIKPILFMFTSAVAIEIYAQTDTTMIGMFSRMENVGYYTNSTKMERLVVTAITAIGTVLLPRFSKYYEQHDRIRINNLVSKTVMYLLLISLPCAVGIFMLSDDIVIVLFGSDFYPAITTLKILSFVIPILAIGNIYGTQIMIASGMERKLTMTVCCGALTNIVINGALIPKFAQNGAAVATVITELLVMILQIFLTRTVVTTFIDRDVVLKMIMQCIVMCIVIILIKMIIVNELVELIICLPVGILLYFGTGLLLKNNFVIELKENISEVLCRKKH